MALAIDGSSPAIVTNPVGTTAPLTTASFTPPAGSMLLVLWAGDALTNPSAPTITDNLGVPLTYSLSDWKSQATAPTVFGQAAIWTAPVVSSAPMTVTVTSGSVSGERTAALGVLVITGQDPSPVGAHGKSGSTSASAIAQNYTAQATNGWGFIAVCDFDAVGAETAGTGCTLIGSALVGSNFDYGFVRRTTADDSNGGTNTLNVTLPGTSTNVAWVYIEILPLAAPAGIVGPPAPQIPPQLLWQLIAANQQQWQQGTVPGVQTTADSGASIAGVASTGTAVKVAVVSGRSCVSAASSGTAAKRAATTGAGTAGAVGTGADRKVTPQTSRAAAGIVGTGADRKVAPNAGLSAAGIAGTGADRKLAPQSARATAGVLSFGATSSSGARAQTGTSSAGVAARGSAAKVAASSSRAAAGCAGRAAAIKVALPQAGACAGTAGRASMAKRAIPLASSALAAAAYATVGHRALPTSRGTVAVIGSHSSANIPGVLTPSQSGALLTPGYSGSLTAAGSGSGLSARSAGSGLSAAKSDSTLTAS